MRRANRALIRFDNPRCASASVTTTGTRANQAATATGTETNPPPASTASGRILRRIDVLRTMAKHACASARSWAIPGRLGSDETGIPCTGNPRRSTTLISDRTLRQMTSTPHPNSRSSSETASAGARCPIVPPAATTTLGARGVRGFMCTACGVALDVFARDADTRDVCQ